MSVRIVTDSTCDLPAETIARYGIIVIPLYINVGNQGYLDGIDITRSEFYQRLPYFPSTPSTAVPSQKIFCDAYSRLIDEGATEIISIHISSALSGVVDVAISAVKESGFGPVTVLDSRQLSLGTGFLVETAAILAEAGHSIEFILKTLNEQIKRSHVFAVLDTLEYLQRSGRMNRIMANLGSLLQIKPILTMYDGKPGNERVRTREKATRRLLEMLRSVGRIERIAILHTNAPERVAELRVKAAEYLPANQIIVADITPVIGAHIGPGAYGFSVISSKI